MGSPLRQRARRARAAARRLTRGWGAREAFAQEGLLAERTMSVPARPPASRPTAREDARDRHAAREDGERAVLGPVREDELARLRRRSERARDRGDDRSAEECA